jgi:hypothetical protein
MKKNIVMSLFLGLSLYAQSSGFKILTNESSKKLFSVLNVAVIDADDIIQKHFITTDLTISCFKSVVDKSANCHVPDEEMTLTGSDAKKLYKVLKSKIEDHDDILKKTFKVEDFKIECEFYVVDKDYTCLLIP